MSRGHRWRASVVVVLALVLVQATGALSARAETDTSGGSARVIGERTIEARAFDWSSFRRPASGSASSAAPRCRWELLTRQEFSRYFDEVLRRSVPFGAQLYRVTCDAGVSWEYGWWVPREPSSVQGAFGSLLQEAIDRLTPPRPAIMTSPPLHTRHVVGLPTWLSVTAASFHTLTLSVTAGDVSVDLTVEPVATRWWIGDGASLRCAGPGHLVDATRPVDVQSSECVHTFEWPSTAPSAPGTDTFGEAPAVGSTLQGRWPLGVEVEYRAAARIVTARGQEILPLGVVLGPPAAEAVEVTEVQAIRVR